MHVLLYSRDSSWSNLILNDRQHGLSYLIVNLLALLCQLVKNIYTLPLGSNDATQYRSIVGALRYLTLIWPNIVFRNANKNRARYEDAARTHRPCRSLSFSLSLLAAATWWRPPRIRAPTASPAHGHGGCGGGDAGSSGGRSAECGYGGDRSARSGGNGAR